MIDKRIYINIEVKTPFDQAVNQRYDFKKTIAMVYDVIREYGIADHCCISSFDQDLLEEMDNLRNAYKLKVDIIYLHNFFEHFELPDPSIYTVKGDGINISSTKLTSEVVKACH